MTAANREVPASKEELIQSVADELGWSKAMTRLHLERIRDDFNGRFGDRIDPRTGLSRFHEDDLSPTETLTRQRDQFLDVERACQAAAAAVSRAPQEVDWLPAKLHLRDSRSGVERQFEVQLTPLDYSGVSWAYAEAAKQAADKLEQAGLRREGYHPEEKAIAVHAWTLMHGPFIPEPGRKLQQRRTNAEYVAANWARLSRKFRGAYSRLQKLRRKRWRQLLRLGRRREKYMQARPLNPVLPRPVVDQYVPPIPKPTRFPRERHRNVTAWLFEYLTDVHKEPDDFTNICDEVRKEFEP
jgi:hypothetical protein